MIHEEILERYFWSHVDRGTDPANTPLLKDPHLAEAIAREFSISAAEAEIAVENAQMEVMS